jgi:hypothetical protein
MHFPTGEGVGGMDTTEYRIGGCLPSDAIWLSKICSIPTLGSAKEDDIGGKPFFSGPEGCVDYPAMKQADESAGSSMAPRH